jgi:amidohydrolase
MNTRIRSILFVVFSVCSLLLPAFDGMGLAFAAEVDPLAEPALIASRMRTAEPALIASRMRTAEPGAPADSVVKDDLVVADVADAVNKKTAADIDREIEKIRADLIKIRRFIHMNPQLPGRESETAKLISGRLLALGIEVRSGAAKTGLVGLLRGGQPGPWVAIRADLDAEAVQEQGDAGFKSLNPGVMHASGHDIHTTIGLGTAMVLSALKDQWRGGVKFIFQPGTEESAAGDEGGAALMIKEGVLDNPPVAAIFGLHLWTDLLGQAYLASGPFLAASDSFHIQVRGKSAAAGQAPESPDAVVLAAQIIIGLQTLLGRVTDPTDPVQLIIGRIEGGTKEDAPADRVTIDGVLRTLTEASRKRLPRAMENVAKGIAQSFGGEATFQFAPDIPTVYNHPDLLRLMSPTFDETLGEKRLVEIKPQMMADDFGRYGQRIPSLFFFLGARNPRLGPLAPLHSPNFNPDERTISLGIKLMAHLLIDCLEQQDGADKTPR